MTGRGITTDNELLSANQETCAAAALPPAAVAPFIPSLSDDAELVRDLPPYPLQHTTSRAPDADDGTFAGGIAVPHSNATSPEAQPHHG